MVPSSSVVSLLFDMVHLNISVDELAFAVQAPHRDRSISMASEPVSSVVILYDVIVCNIKFVFELF
jgi:hypothetical protein